MFKNNNNVILKTLLISILMICLSSFLFAIHDTLLKYISSGKLGNIKWYHHVTIGGPFGIAQFSPISGAYTQSGYALKMAAVSCLALPSLFLFFFLQKYFIIGLSQGSVK